MSESESKLFGGEGPVKLSSSIEGGRLKHKDERELTSYEKLKAEMLEKEKMNMGYPEPSMVTGSERSYSERYKTPGMKDAEELVVELHDEPAGITASADEIIQGPIESNIATSWAPTQKSPIISRGSFVHPRGLVVGNVVIQKGVFIGPFTAIRGDEEEPIYIGEESAILEGCMINALPTNRAGRKISHRLLKVGAKEYPLYISGMVTVCQGVNIMGPAFIGKNSYVGMGSLVFWAEIGRNCVIEPGALVINVKIPDDRFVPAGLAVTNQKIVDSLPQKTSKYRFNSINDEMLDENREILLGYLNR